MPRHGQIVTSSPPTLNIRNGFGGSSADYGLRPNYDPNVQPVEGWSLPQHPDFVSKTGGNQPHNNMPPYIALYFCKKD